MPVAAGSVSWWISFPLSTLCLANACLLLQVLWACESRSPHPQHKYGQAQILLGLLRRPVNVFLYLGTGPGSLLAETWSKELTPPSYNRVSFGQGLGRAYTQCVHVDLLLASKTTGVDDALYFHYEQRTLHKFQARILINEYSLNTQIHICNLLLQRFK